jgi:hypothetical protein
MIELEALSARLLALALPTELTLSTLPCGVPITLDEIEEAASLTIEDPDETASAIEELAADATDSMVPWAVLVPIIASLASLIFSATFCPATTAAAGIILLAQSSLESPVDIFHRPVSLRRASSFAASSAVSIALFSTSSDADRAFPSPG